MTVTPNVTITPTITPTNTVTPTVTPTTSPPALLMEDNFIDTNGTAIADHTPDVDTVGGGWGYWPTGVGGEIQNNILVHSGSRGGPNIDVGVADYVLEARCRKAVWQSSPLMFRNNDATNRSYGVEITNAGIGVKYYNGGTWGGTVNSGPDNSLNTWYIIKVIVTGTTCDVYRNDVLTISAYPIPFNPTVTYVGPFGYGFLTTNGMEVDWIKVYSL
jgi:hypothetical protein